MNALDDEVDLRQYVWAVLRNWRLVAGLAIVTGTVAAGLGLLRQPVYTATSLVSVAQLPYSLRLEGVVQTEPLPERSYQDLALSDEVVAAVLAETAGLFTDETPTLEDFRQRLEAASGSTTSLMKLSVHDGDANRAAAIANAWAEALAARAALLYGPGTAQLESYSAQLAGAESELLAAEQALTAYEADNELLLRLARLDSLRASLADYLDREHIFELLRRDAQNLLARMEQADPQAPASLADETALLLLVAQAQSLNSRASIGAGAGGSAPAQIQIQIGGATTSGQTAGQLLVTLRAYLDALEAQRTDARVQAEALSPALLDVQGQVAAAKARLRDLTRARDQAETQYLALARKVDEVQIAAQDAGASIKIASRAAVPHDASGGAILLGLAGLVAGAGLGVFLVLLRDWLRPPARTAAAASRAAPGQAEEPPAAVPARPGLG
ncbi:MAG: hypothetical protein IT317_15775 [Anaerolineales bacterium]|nr:hypothetical protein [Anaerolineales bacterium]